MKNEAHLCLISCLYGINSAFSAKARDLGLPGEERIQIITSILQLLIGTVHRLAYIGEITRLPRQL